MTDLAPTILVIDNYDSFAYNLVQYVGSVVTDLGGDESDVVVRRNDAIDVDGVRDLDPDGVVVSPGPGIPEEAGVTTGVFAELSYPTLGVCLGHQALCAASGAPVGHADAVVHGKASPVTHDGTGIFRGLPDPLEAGRYHSLAVHREDLPDCLEETARTVASEANGRGSSDDEAGGQAASDGEANGHGASDDEADWHRTDDERGRPDAGIVMGVRHRERPHVGVQFHPESILTDGGEALVENFCLRCNTT